MYTGRCSQVNAPYWTSMPTFTPRGFRRTGFIWMEPPARDITNHIWTATRCWLRLVNSAPLCGEKPFLCLNQPLLIIFQAFLVSSSCLLSVSCLGSIISTNHLEAMTTDIIVGITLKQTIIDNSKSSWDYRLQLPTLSLAIRGAPQLFTASQGSLSKKGEQDQ